MDALQFSTPIDAEGIARGLDKARRSGDGWTACCPAHEDANPSLSIGDGDKGPVVKCHGGCEQGAVIDALKARGLWRSRETPSKGESRYPYYRADGSLVLTVVRRDGPNGKDLHREPRGVRCKLPLYGLARLAQDKKRVLIVEGEKCVHAARFKFPDEPIVTWAGGTEAWKRTDWKPLYDREVTILADQDEPGRKCARAIAEHLAKHGRKAKEIRLALPPGDDKRDIADVIEAGENAGAYLKLHKHPLAWHREHEPDPQAAMKYIADGKAALVGIDGGATPAAPAPAAVAGNWADRNRHFQVLGVKGDKVILRVGDEIVSRPFDRVTGPAVLRGLAPASFWTGLTGDEKLSQEAAGRLGFEILRSGRRRGRVQLDGNPDLAGLPDGRVVDLRTGSIRDATEDGDRYILGKLGAVPESGEPTLWLETLGELFGGGHPEAIGFLQRWFGYCLTGHTWERLFLHAYGESGTGKSTVQSVLVDVAGTYAVGASIRGFFGSLSDHAEYLHRIKDRRLVYGDDVPDRNWQLQPIKSIASGDVITGARSMGEGGEDFRPMAKLFFTSNFLPDCPGDVGLAARIVPLEMVRPQPRTQRKRDLEAELPRIVAWAIEGAVQWHRGGLGLTGLMESARITFAEIGDTVGAWIGDRCDVGEGFSVTTTELLKGYRDATDRTLSPRRLASWMAGPGARMDIFPDKNLPGGRRGYRGIRVRHQI